MTGKDNRTGQPAAGFGVRGNVPCNGCTRCCQGDLLMLHPEMGDDPAEYHTVPARNPVTGEMGTALAHGENGSCVYLRAKGCTIHDRAPAICKEFDCRGFVLSMERKYSRKENRRLIRSGLLSKYVLTEGRKRLHTLKDLP